jgi:lysine-N-methylase
MSLNLRRLPIVEHWDCHHCTACCRETTIQLNPDDLARLQQQRWDQHPEFRGIQTVRRALWLAGSRVLAHQPDGSCVFLSEAGLCRIHERFGADAKPFMCRQFPLQVVATDRAALATVVRSCPSAAADRGRPVDEHLAFLKRLFRDNLPAAETAIVPPIIRRTIRSWDDFHRLAEALERLLTDARLPLVRRLVHSLSFCSLIDQCKWKRVGSDAVAELADLFERSASSDVGELFLDRQPPKASTARLFRRLGAHFIRCVPGGPPTRTLADHWRVFRLSGQLARASRQLPQIHPRFPSTNSEQLERPLGPLADEVLLPLTRFYETNAVSKRYLLTQPTFSLVASVRRLAFTFPMALWMLRWLSADREPTADDMVQIVVALERGSAMPALSRAANFLAESGQLDCLIAWYGR